MASSPYARFGATTLNAPNQTARRHTIVGGETLPAIAAMELGTGYDSELWRQIAEYNAIDDLDAITVGQVLAIPPPQPSDT